MVEFMNQWLFFHGIRDWGLYILYIRSVNGVSVRLRLFKSRGGSVYGTYCRGLVLRMDLIRECLWTLLSFQFIIIGCHCLLSTSTPKF
jgi:hypothetical protein